MNLRGLLLREGRGLKWMGGGREEAGEEGKGGEGTGRDGRGVMWSPKNP